MCPVDEHGEQLKETPPEIPEAEKIEKFGLAIAAYFSTAIDLLVKPRLHARKKNLTVNGALIVFVLVSLLGSTTLCALTFGQDRIAPLLGIYVVTLLSWVIFGAFSHVVCYLLGGRAALKTGVALVMQVLSVVTLLVAFFGYAFSLVSGSGMWATLNSMAGVEILLFVCYFPLCLGALYNFGPLRSGLAGIFLAVVFFILNALLVVLTNLRQLGKIIPAG